MTVIERTGSDDTDDRIAELEAQLAALESDVLTLTDVQSDLESRADDLEAANGALVDCVESMHRAMTLHGIDTDGTFFVAGC